MVKLQTMVKYLQWPDRLFQGIFYLILLSVIELLKAELCVKLYFFICPHHNSIIVNNKSYHLSFTMGHALC